MSELSLAPGQQLRLRHALHVNNLTLPAATTVRILSVHRLHVRAEVELDGLARRLRLPLEALDTKPDVERA